MEISRLGALPTELKENVLLYLPGELDRYNLAQACPEFDEHLRSIISRSLDFSFEVRLDDETLLKIFKRMPNPSHVTHLNLNGLYWIDPEIIKYGVNKFTNLECLFIVDTRMDYVQMNAEFITKAKKLHTIAIDQFVNAIKDNMFTKSFLVVRNENQHCIKYAYEKYILHGNRMTVVVTPTLAPGFTYVLNERNWINGLCNSCSFKQFREDQLQLHKEIRMDIYYDTLLDLRDRPHIREEKELSKVTELIVRNPQKKGLSLPSLNMTLKPITYFKNLRKLTFDFTYGVSFILLEEVFKECGLLTSLKIATRDPNFTLKYLEHAKSLEEVSLNTKGRFDFYTSFGVMGAPENLKLKRIYIRCGEFLVTLYDNFERFIGENPWLQFFHVECVSSNFEMGKIARTMEDSRRRPSQHFGINKCTIYSYPDVRGIPVSHIDMLPMYECSGHSSYINV